MDSGSASASRGRLRPIRAVLLMDEPFGALDPVTRAELQREFRSIQQRVGKTVVIVTHDMLEALALADRVAVLDGGVLIACEPPETSSSPRTLTCAGCSTPCCRTIRRSH